MLLTRRGFTLVELLIALMLMGIVSAGIYTLLINNQRLYRQQTQTIDVNDNLRSTVAILTSELRELDTQDSSGSDILEMTDSYITYRAMRGIRWVCSPPAGLPVTTTYIALDTSRFGYPGIDASYDSLLIFADHDAMKTSDDRWYHADVTSAPNASVDCGGASRRVNYSVNGQNGATLVPRDDVLIGAPVRPFEIVRMSRYTDVSGATWVGMQRHPKNGSSFDPIQPVAGPLQNGGLTFAYYGADGAVTADRARVARIQITVIARTMDPVMRTSTGAQYLVDTMVTQVALRNSR